MWNRLSVMGGNTGRCGSKGDCPSVWEDDQDPDVLLIVGHRVAHGTVPMADDEVAVRIQRQVVADAKIR